MHAFVHNADYEEAYRLSTKLARVRALRSQSNLSDWTDIRLARCEYRLLLRFLQVLGIRKP